MKISRLSDQNIKDDILRCEFYRRVLDHVNKPQADLKQYTVRIDEAFRHDLVSYRIYGTVELSWLILLLNDLDDEAEPLTVGSSFFYPPAQEIRQIMRRFIDEMELN